MYRIIFFFHWRVYFNCASKSFMHLKEVSNVRFCLVVMALNTVI